ncbi:hypothetical protein P2H44_06390 [Albimonas sp. CAU 1670]|uniref:hypothetical protein n=1 Tax=Albimonas sp. CAU 1670 TaxID=3032599 RepID=UPI0023DBF1E4|nr:hypothetical protein [Albimonas sp. CAU 1670]MDF2232178.1 hypothetical protein [Albimonas sp. CAU 1670]
MTRKTNTKGRAADEEAKTSAAAEKPEQEPATKPATAEATETVSATHSEGQAEDQGAQTSASAEGGTQAPEADAAPAASGEDGGAPEPAIQDDEPSGLEVVVVGPKRGRWRAGRHFGAEPVRIPEEELSEDDKAALLADPVLIVSVAEVSRRP